MTRRPWPAGLLTVSAALLTVLVATGPAGAHGTQPRHLEAASTAIPSRVGATAHGTIWHVQQSRARAVNVDATATSSADCDGCAADAVTLQVVYAGRAGAVVGGNAAVAWTSGCTACRGWALSVQVVVTGSASEEHVGNRALALTAGCRSCAAGAVAVQLVAVVGAAESDGGLSSRALAQIVALRDQLAAQLAASTWPPAGRAPAGRAYPQGRAIPGAAAPAQAQGAAATAAADMEAVLASDLGTTATSRDVQVSAG